MCGVIYDVCSPHTLAKPVKERQDLVSCVHSFPSPRGFLQCCIWRCPGMCIHLGRLSQKRAQNEVSGNAVAAWGDVSLGESLLCWGRDSGCDQPCLRASRECHTGQQWHSPWEGGDMSSRSCSQFPQPHTQALGIHLVSRAMLP